MLIEPHIRLSEVPGQQQLTVRSGLHQAVGEVAPDLTVSARGVDGVAEAAG